MNTQKLTWQQSLTQAFTDMDALCEYLQLDINKLSVITDFKDFPLLVPRGFAQCMQIGNPDDPLLRQVLLASAELLDFPGYSHDPVGDLQAIGVPGVIHKYHGRVLLIATGACAIHCRYCFRRHFPYGELQLSSQKLQQAIAYIAQRPEITEVIFSGGDPLLLSDAKLAHILEQLNEISHVKRIRFHSRVPVVLPERITPELLAIFAAITKPCVLVIHANHAHELTAEFGRGCAELKKRNITLLNQSVLLKQVNDSADVLLELSEHLFEFGVLPYYLHLLDRTSGAAHFAVSETDALLMLQQLREQLPGYLVPILVKEQAGAAHKIVIN